MDTRDQTVEILDLDTGERLEAELAIHQVEEIEPKLPVSRLSIVASFATMSAAVMVGGTYIGWSPRFFAAVAGILGVLLAGRARLLKNAWLSNAAIALGVGLIGILMTIPAGSFSDVLNLGPFVREAVASGDVLRPPVEFTLGWHAIIGWLMGGVGFAAGWIAIEMRKPALGLLVPLPIVVVSAISVPADAKLASGIAALVLFAIGLGLLSGIDLAGDGDQRSLAFELRRAARALPLIAIITVALVGLARANFLFPRPIFDPTQSAQKPKTIPLSEVKDRVLFTVSSSVTGPWRMGTLDVYDGADWRLPPFAESNLEEVPSSGIVDSELQPGVKATFDIKDLGGAILPGLPNTVGMVAEGPALAYDTRNGNIRVAQGQIQPGLRYTVVAARVPTIEELRNVTPDVPSVVKRFLEIPPAPSAVQSLIARAPSTNQWDKFDFIRQEFLKTVKASGAGVPVSVPPSKVQDMLAGSKEGSPYEIVAAQAMLARWAGVPSRIGYGFDGGDKAGDVVEVRPKHGASFIEVYFPGYKWLPVIGNPLQAKASFGGTQTKNNEQVQASDDIAVQVFIPFESLPESAFLQQFRQFLAVVLPGLALIALMYILWPGARKALIRSRRRSWAHRHGPGARIALAYAEWRDLSTDFGYHYLADTPLMFLDRVTPDDEHTELAWLVTRTLWGDLAVDLSNEDAVAAEELARSLRKRLAQAHPFTIRAVAALSRLSLKQPYAPDLAGVHVGPKRKQKGQRVPQPV